MPPQPLFHSPELQDESSESSVLLSISSTVSDLQQQLSDAKQKDVERDEVLKKVQKELEELKAENQRSEQENCIPMKGRKSPRGLSVSCRFCRQGVFYYTHFFHVYRLVFVRSIDL